MLNSPEMFSADDEISAINGGKSSLKRQKLADNLDSIKDSMNNSISITLDHHQSRHGMNEQIYNNSHHHPTNAKYNQTGAGNKVDKGSASGNTSVFNPSSFKDISRKKLIERYQREDDENCYYVNPIRCSFDDPKLIFEEMCYLCGAFGN